MTSLFYGGLPDHLMTHTVGVQRKVPTRDASGGAKENYVAVAGLQSLQASIQPLRGRGARDLGQRQVFVTHNIYFQRPAAVLRGDRITDSSGVSYVIQSIEDSAGRGLFTKVQAYQET